MIHFYKTESDLSCIKNDLRYHFIIKGLYWWNKNCSVLNLNVTLNK